MVGSRGKEVEKKKLRQTGHLPSTDSPSSVGGQELGLGRGGCQAGGRRKRKRLPYRAGSSFLRINEVELDMGESSFVRHKPYNI